MCQKGINLKIKTEFLSTTDKAQIKYNQQLMKICCVKYSILTKVRKIVQQKNFFNQERWRPVQYRMNGPHQCRPSFIVENNDNACRRQV